TNRITGHMLRQLLDGPAGSPAGRPVSARRTAALLAIAATLALAAPSLAGPAPVAETPEEAYWITIGADVSARVQQKLEPLPGWTDGVVLERFDEHDGVVLTRIPAGALDELSEIVHEEFRSCGGF